MHGCKSPIANMSKNKPNILMTNEACESKLPSVVRSSMHPYPGNRVAIGRAVVYYAWAARKFSAGIKCRHFTSDSHSVLRNFSSYSLYNDEGLKNNINKSCIRSHHTLSLLPLLCYSSIKE